MKWMIVTIILLGCQSKVMDSSPSKEVLSVEEQEVKMSEILGEWVFVELVDGIFTERTYTFSDSIYTIQYLERKLGLGIILVEEGKWILDHSTIVFKVERDSRYFFREGVLYRRHVSFVGPYMFLDDMGGTRVLL